MYDRLFEVFPFSLDQNHCIPAGFSLCQLLFIWHLISWRCCGGETRWNRKCYNRDKQVSILFGGSLILTIIEPNSKTFLSESPKAKSGGKESTTPLSAYARLWTEIHRTFTQSLLTGLWSKGSVDPLALALKQVEAVSLLNDSNVGHILEADSQQMGWSSLERVAAIALLWTHTSTHQNFLLGFCQCKGAKRSDPTQSSPALSFPPDHVPFLSCVSWLHEYLHREGWIWECAQILPKETGGTPWLGWRRRSQM